MNLDPHWLKDHFKEVETESLEGELSHLEIFGGMPAVINMIQAELARRVKESNETNG